MIEPIRCETCNTPTTNIHTGRCDNCRSVERRLPEYLKHRRGMAFARKAVPLLDDWVDNKPDAWDFDAVLKDNEVTVEWLDTLVDGEGNRSPAGEYTGWGFGWKYGGIHIGPVTETIARKAAALFVSLWLRGVSASFADKLMDGYICFLERQEETSLTFLAEIKHAISTDVIRLTRKGFCTVGSLDAYAEQIIEALGVPGPDEEIIVTFAKRKKGP